MPRTRITNGLSAAALVAAMLLLMSVEPGRSDDKPLGPADRMKSANSLKQLVLAFHNYADTHQGEMPPAAVYGKDGKPLYSWRVLLLPYLDEKKLFEEFHLDEPWDSAHNKKLLEKMPKVFAPIGGEAAKEHKTYYQVFVGPDTPFSMKNRGPRMPASFPDGTSNTFLIAEAAKPVHWTAPMDIPFDAKKPVPKLGGLLKNGFNAALADGSVRFYKKGKLSDHTLRLAIMPADGLVLGSDF